MLDIMITVFVYGFALIVGFLLGFVIDKFTEWLSWILL